MKSQPKKSAGRFLIVLLVPIIAAALWILLEPRQTKDTSESTTSEAADIERVVQRLFTQYRIGTVRTRSIVTGGRGFRRIERRVSVPEEFNTLSFNHDLTRALAEHGATVIATEKLEDNSVGMHIKKDGVIIETIVFEMNRTR